VAVVEALDLNLGAQDARDMTAKLNDAVMRTRLARATMDDRIAGSWARYEIAPPDRKLNYDQEPNLRVPLTKWIVDGVWVRMMRTIWGQQPYLRVVDEDLADPPEALPVQLMLQHLADTDLQLRFRAGHLFLNALVEGTAVGKLIRKIDSRRIRDKTGDLLSESTITDKVGFALDVIDFKDFWVAHPGIVDLNKQPWVAHRVWLTWEEMRARQRDGRFTVTRDQMDKLKPLGKKRLVASPISALDQAKSVLEKSEDAGWATVDEWEVLEVEGSFDPTNQEQWQECLFNVMVGWNDFPLRAQKYPFWNGTRDYLVYRPKPRANRFYGQSAAGEVQALQDEGDARLNQDLSAKTLAVLAGLTPVLPRSMQREWDRHKWQLLKPIYLDAPEQFRTLAQFTMAVRELDPLLEKLFQIAERISGMSDPQLGKPVTGSKTAFEIATVQSEGNIKFAEMIEQLQIGNTELGYQVIEHAYQLAMEDPMFAQRIAKVSTTDPFAGITLAELRQRWQVIPVGNTMIANKEANARMWMGVYELFKDDIFVIANPEHSYFLRNRVLQSIGVDREIEKLIGTEAEVKTFADQQLQLRAQQGDLSAQVQLQHRAGPGGFGRGRTFPLGTQTIPGTIVPPGQIPQ